MSGKGKLKFLEAEQFRVIDEQAYGVRGGYPVELVWINRKRIQVFLTVNASLLPEQAHQIQLEANQQGVMLRAGDRQVFYDWKGPVEQVLQNVDAIVSILQTNGIYPPRCCAICGEDAPNAAMLCGKRYDMVHSNCVEEWVQKASATEKQGSYGKGFLGALLGAVVGILPSILIAVLFQAVSGLLLILMPICSAWGYFKLGGRRDKKAILLCILSSFVGLGLSLISWDVYINCNWMGMSVGEGLLYTLENMSFSGYWDHLLANLWDMFIYGIAGMVLMAQYVKGRIRTGKRTVKEQCATLVGTDSGRTRVYTGSTSAAEHTETVETPNYTEPPRYETPKNTFGSNSFSKRKKDSNKGWDPWD